MKLPFNCLLAALVIGTHSIAFGAPSSPATNDDFNTAVVSASPLRTAYMDVVQTYGTTPESLDDIQYTEPDVQNDYVSHADIDPVSNAILLGLAPEFGQNEWVALIPTVENFTITQWTCQTTVSEAIADNSGCRGGLSYSAITQIASSTLLLETLTSLRPIQTNYVESYQTNGQLPRALIEVGVDDQWINDSNADHIMLEAKRRAILVGLSDVFGTNEWLALVPRVTRRGIRWYCRTTLPADLVTPVAYRCRSGLRVEQLIP